MGRPGLSTRRSALPVVADDAGAEVERLGRDDGDRAGVRAAWCCRPARNAARLEGRTTEGGGTEDQGPRQTGRPHPRVPLWSSVLRPWSVDGFAGGATWLVRWTVGWRS